MDVRKIKERERLFREKDTPFAIHTIKSKSRWWSEIELKNVYNHLNVKQNNTILDIGCSDGRLCEYIHKKNNNCRLVGVDFARNPIKTLLKKDFDCYALCGDVCTLPFKPNTFDNIAAIQTIQQVPSQEERIKSLRTISSLLKPAGTFVITSLNQRFWHPLVEDGKEGPLIGAEDLHVCLYSPETLKFELEQSGLIVEDIMGINVLSARYLKILGAFGVHIDLLLTKYFKKFSINKSCYFLAKCKKNLT